MIETSNALQATHIPFTEFDGASNKSLVGDLEMEQQWEFLDNLS